MLPTAVAGFYLLSGQHLFFMVCLLIQIINLNKHFHKLIYILFRETLNNFI